MIEVILPIYETKSYKRKNLKERNTQNTANVEKTPPSPLTPQSTILSIQHFHMKTIFSNEKITSQCEHREGRDNINCDKQVIHATKNVHFHSK